MKRYHPSLSLSLGPLFSTPCTLVLHIPVLHFQSTRIIITSCRTDSITSLAQGSVHYSVSYSAVVPGRSIDSNYVLDGSICPTERDNFEGQRAHMTLLADPRGVQGVWTSALLIRVPFMKHVVFNSTGCIKIHHFDIINAKFFWGGAQPPPQTQPPLALDLRRPFQVDWTPVLVKSYIRACSK